ncbi:hypothetical protein LSM04_000534 [Trypanosoma melophagium]|uniref:uncharacterized protein n=1 Tax=Trypanosoma melophagium TaxID=715481 RepID=UPI00351A1EC6|nr:hypothetical protein LSM04_000534 [Trypanosoma melophagium]
MEKEANDFSGGFGSLALKEGCNQYLRLLDVYPDRKEIEEGRLPCLIAFDISTRQKRYMKSVLNSIRPIDKTHLSYFQEDYLLESSEFYPTLTWKEIAERINNGPMVGIYFYSCSRLREKLQIVYEEYYQGIIRDGYRDIIGFFTTVDGLVPFVDYLHARHFGGMQPPTLRFPDVLPPTFAAPPGKVQSMHGNRDGKGVEAETRGTVVNLCKHRTRILYGNDVETSVKRRQNKYSMQLTLRDHGLAYIRGNSGKYPKELKQWRCEEDIPFPVIVKPVSGGGSEYVSLCHNEHDIDAAFALCNGAYTVQETQASHMLLQEYIEGQEYVVNVVSYNGRHVVSDVWKSWKFPAGLNVSRGSGDVLGDLKFWTHGNKRVASSYEYNTTALLYDRLEFVHNLAELHEESEERRVVSYVLQCIDALGMRQGSSHCEVRVDNRPGSKNKGKPVLIELNARVLGDTPRSTSFVGYDQIMLMMYLAYCAASIPEKQVLSGSGRGDSNINSNSSTSTRSNEVNKVKETRMMLPWPPAPLLYRSLSTKTTCHVIFLRSKEDSYFCTTGLNFLKGLPTFKYISRNNFLDEQGRLVAFCLLKKTVDLLTSPAACVMEGTEEDIRRDSAIIREIENKDISSWDEFLDDALLEMGHLSFSRNTTNSRKSTQNSATTTTTTKNSNNAIKQYSAFKMVKHLFATEPVLYVPESYCAKLHLLDLIHLLREDNNGSPAS